MTAQEFYRSTRSVDFNNWPLSMVLKFAEEYHKSEMQIYNSQFKQAEDKDMLNYPHKQLEIFEENE